ncbi:MAG: TIGR03620 family F420-dependent LLM class oxidoreductase [Gammaproteobacteria bacterium]|nr:TIGR03620 family F420-dependent LLM class oxidoreductase [Gammaproteobacteria bacterium]
MDLRKLGVWYFTEGFSAQEAAAFATRVEDLGYSAIWIPETVGRHPFALASWLLANTSKLVVATGIANIYHREPGVTHSAQQTLAEQSDGRFLLGLGVSHKPLVEGLRGLRYGKPVATMSAYLDKMVSSPYSGPAPTVKTKTVIAALGPKMLELAAQRCDGAHPYFTSPDHTLMAREILGPDPLLCVEQKVVLETDPSKARSAARRSAAMYMGLPNYRKSWLRMGLLEEDIEGQGSDRFIDATFAWGDLDAIKKRVQQHYDAGASHVCVQPIASSSEDGPFPWKTLELLAPNSEEQMFEMEE